MATRRKQNIWPFGSRATSPRNVTPASGGIAARAGRPSVSRRAPATRAVEWKGFQIVPDGDGFRVPAIDPGSLFDTAADAKRFISDEVKLRRNPGRSIEKVSADISKLVDAMNLSGNTRAPEFYLVADGVSIPVSKQYTREDAEAKAAELNNKRAAAGKSAVYGVYVPDRSSRIGYRANPGGAQQVDLWKGSRVVRMFSNDGEWWTGNLYVNNGETITGIRKSGVKRATLEKWAHRELEKASRSNPSDREAGERARFLSPAGRTRALKEHIDWVEKVERGGRKLSPGERKILQQRFYSEARRRNPADAAAAGFEMFHGSPSSEVVEVTEQVHYHKHLSSAGELKELQIQAIDGRAVVKLSGFGGSLLTFNEKRNQLFVTGGDQEVNLAAFGINPKRAHELETLGALVSLDYFTDKKHLGAEGGAAIYRHKLRTTNENGRHITVKLARYPDVVYRVPEKRLEFSGGSYEILPEGINL